MEPLLDTRRYLIPFRGTLLPQIFTRTLVIGGGVAGLRAALAAAEHGEVILLCKRGDGDSNTAWAQGGIAAVTTDSDTIESHIADTLDAGAGFCDEPAVRTLAEEGPAAIDELRAWGMRFDLDERGEPALGLEGGHSAPRILHAAGDATGKELARCLWSRVRATPEIRVFDSCFALDLLTPTDSPGSPCVGAVTHHQRYGLQMIWASATILATGGAGVLWRETTNPPVATADGLALAWRAGAALADLAFMQFHPTALYLAGASRALISEAVRGEGATLVDDTGRRFMQEADERGDLAPRDVVARAIVAQIARTGATSVWLDARSIDRFAERFPSIARVLNKFEIDPATDPIPVRPAAHYMIGGVRTDLDGRTSVPGLYAAGEVSCTGVNGANRLASNSLLEGLVFGSRAGRVCAERATEAPAPAPIPIVSNIPDSERGLLDLEDVRSSLRSAMWRNVGLERTGARLLDATEMFDFWSRYTLDKVFDEPAGWETQNMLVVGALVARAALAREETRGCHVRADHPRSSDEFLAHDIWRRGESAPVMQPVLLSGDSNISCDGVAARSAPRLVPGREQRPHAQRPIPTLPSGVSGHPPSFESVSEKGCPGTRRPAECRDVNSDRTHKDFRPTLPTGVSGHPPSFESVSEKWCPGTRRPAECRDGDSDRTHKDSHPLNHPIARPTPNHDVSSVHKVPGGTGVSSVRKA